MEKVVETYQRTEFDRQAKIISFSDGLEQAAAVR
jgi:hypothetical protein